MRYIKLFNEGFFSSDTEENKFLDEPTKDIISIIKDSLLRGKGQVVKVIPEMIKFDYNLKDITKPMDVIQGDVEGSRNGQKFQLFGLGDKYFLSLYNPKPGSLYTEDKPVINNFSITREQSQDFRNCMLNYL